jgi:hypothetical protein
MLMEAHEADVSGSLPQMMRPPRIVSRTFAKAAGSCAGSASNKTRSASIANATRPLRPAYPYRWAGAVVKALKIALQSRAADISRYSSVVSNASVYPTSVPKRIWPPAAA